MESDDSTAPDCFPQFNTENNLFHLETTQQIGVGNKTLVKINCYKTRLTFKARGFNIYL